MSARGGIDLGGTKIQAIVFDEETAKVVGSSRRPTPTSGGPRTVADAMAAVMNDAAADAGITTPSLLGVGVGSPGEVDADAGTVARAANLPGWEEPFALGATLSEQLGAPVSIGNDVSVATHAELVLGAGRGRDALLGVFWGTGVGGGVVVDGHSWRGRGAAGEIGHMVVRRGGARCPCGRRGCMEAYAGRRAMEERARRLHKRGRKTKLFEIMEESGRTSLTSGVWERALRKQDGLAVELIERAIAALGAGIASAVNLLDVDLVVIGGGLGVRFGAPMVERISNAMRPHLFVDERPVPVQLVELGDLGGAIGAALLSADRTVSARVA
jgi:glucokinase